MKLLLDTHLLLWAAERSARLPKDVENLLEDKATELIFSVVSIWEVAIKRALALPHFMVDPSLLRRGLIDNGYRALPVTGMHAVMVAGLPLLHGDPFDRIMIAQALTEGITFMTSDKRVAQYAGPIRLV